MHKATSRTWEATSRTREATSQSRKADSQSRSAALQTREADFGEAEAALGGREADSAVREQGCDLAITLRRKAHEPSNAVSTGALGEDGVLLALGGLQREAEVGPLGHRGASVVGQGAQGLRRQTAVGERANDGLPRFSPAQPRPTSPEGSWTAYVRHNAEHQILILHHLRQATEDRGPNQRGDEVLSGP